MSEETKIKGTPWGVIDLTATVGVITTNDKIHVATGLLNSEEPVLIVFDRKTNKPIGCWVNGAPESDVAALMDVDTAYYLYEPV